MRRLILLLLPLIALLGLAGTADAATATSYTRTMTFGPYDGTARPEYGDPNATPDGEALTLSCIDGGIATRGSVTINTRTSHGTSKKVLVLGKHGEAFNQESGLSMFYAFVTPTGKKGWNSVTLKVTCLTG